MMATVTMFLGSLFNALGLGAYFVADERHITTLIPIYMSAPMPFLGAAEVNKWQADNSQSTTQSGVNNHDR